MQIRCGAKSPTQQLRSLLMPLQQVAPRKDLRLRTDIASRIIETKVSAFIVIS